MDKCGVCGGDGSTCVIGTDDTGRKPSVLPGTGSPNNQPTVLTVHEGSSGQDAQKLLAAAWERERALTKHMEEMDRQNEEERENDSPLRLVQEIKQVDDVIGMSLEGNLHALSQQELQDLRLSIIRQIAEPLGIPVDLFPDEAITFIEESRIAMVDVGLINTLNPTIPIDATNVDNTHAALELGRVEVQVQGKQQKAQAVYIKDLSHQTRRTAVAQIQGIRASTEVLQKAREKKELLAAAEERERALSKRVEELQQQNEQEKAARLLSEEEAARVKAEADEALLAAVQEHHVALQERDALSAELQRRVEEAQKLHEDEKEARAAAEAEIERQALEKGQALLAAAEERHKTEQLSFAAERLGQDKAAADAIASAAMEEVLLLKAAGEAALAAMASQQEEHLRSDTEKDQTIQELLGHVHSFSLARDEEKESRRVAEIKLATLEAEKLELLKTHKAEQKRISDTIKAEKDRSIQRLLNQTSKLAAQRDAVEEARTLMEWQMKTMATEKQEILKNYAKIEAESAKQLQDLLERIKEAHAEVGTLKEAVKGKEEALRTMQQEHKDALMRATELHEQVVRDSAANISWLTNGSEELLTKLKQQEARHKAAEEAARLVVAEKEAAIVHARGQQELLVAEKARQIEDLSAQIAGMIAAIDAEKAARIASEQDAARMKADVTKALKAAMQDVKDHRARLQEREAHAAELQRRVEEAQKLHEDEKEARAAAEAEIERQALEKGQALLAAAEERERLLAEKSSQLQKLEAANAALVGDMKVHLAAREAVEAELKRIAAEHTVTLASKEAERERAVEEKQQQIQSCKMEIDELGKKIAQSNETVASLLDQINDLTIQKQAEAVARAAALDESDRLRRDRDATLADKERLIVQHTAEKTARLSLQDSLEKLSAEKRAAEIEHKREQEKLRVPTLSQVLQ